MRCPQCESDLDATSQCAKCGGKFVVNAELDAMLASVDAKKDERRTMADWPVGTDPSERRCPVCAHEMSRIKVERVFVERCNDHGVWFDRFELDRVLSPNRDEHGFSPRRSSLPVEAVELGTLGTVVQLVYSQIRRTEPQ
jgi:Zn-finger nucleic acid-binding protein